MENSLTHSNSNVSTITAHPTFSSPHTPTMKQTSTFKYDLFYEIIHVPKANQVKDSHFPLLNSYKAFKNSYHSFTIIIKKLISQKVQIPKEYILSTKFD